MNYAVMQRGARDVATIEGGFELGMFNDQVAGLAVKPFVATSLCYPAGHDLAHGVNFCLKLD